MQDGMTPHTDNPFFINFETVEESYSYFMQDGMTPHTAKETIQALRTVFGELNGENGIISKGL
jgi:hypothetical protein